MVVLGPVSSFMRVLCLIAALGLLVKEAMSTVGEAGGHCTTPEMTCTANGAYCDTSSSPAVCRCTTGFVQQGAVCARVHGQVCDLSMCMAGLVCSDNQCVCDTDAVYNNVSRTCDCPPGSAKNSLNKCVKTSGQRCLSADDCLENAECVGGTCKNCSRGYQRHTDGHCYKENSQECSSVSECFPSRGKVCEADYYSRIKLCRCDSRQHMEAFGTTGCWCVNGYTLRDDGTCGVAGYRRCYRTRDCADDLLCVNGLCMCDYTKHLTLNGGSGRGFCRCSSGYVGKTDGSCGATVGHRCYRTTVCADNMVCDNGHCMCDTSKHYRGLYGQRCSCDTKSVSFWNGQAFVCGLLLGSTCSATNSSVPCVKNTVCDPLTNKCVCDAVNNYEPNGLNTNCQCKTGFVESNGECLAPINSYCASRYTANVCVSGATCALDPQDGYPQFRCRCAGSVQSNATCKPVPTYQHPVVTDPTGKGDAAGLTPSLAVLVAAMSVTSYLSVSLDRD